MSYRALYKAKPDNFSVYSHPGSVSLQESIHTCFNQLVSYTGYMGIVKFIELGVWPIKLCLYCFNTSGNQHSNLPRVMNKMNAPSSSEIPRIDPPMCTKTKTKASPWHPQGLWGCWETRERRATGLCGDIWPPNPRLWFETLVMDV